MVRSFTTRYQYPGIETVIPPAYISTFPTTFSTLPRTVITRTRDSVYTTTETTAVAAKAYVYLLNSDASDSPATIPTPAISTSPPPSSSSDFFFCPSPTATFEPEEGPACEVDDDWIAFLKDAFDADSRDLRPVTNEDFHATRPPGFFLASVGIPGVVVLILLLGVVLPCVLRRRKLKKKMEQEKMSGGSEDRLTGDRGSRVSS